MFGAGPNLADVSLAVRPGEISELPGGGGAGKTTLLKILNCSHDDMAPGD